MWHCVRLVAGAGPRAVRAPASSPRYQISKYSNTADQFSTGPRTSSESAQLTWSAGSPARSRAPAAEPRLA